jgi:hypothetical protein
MIGTKKDLWIKNGGSTDDEWAAFKLPEKTL